MSEEKVYVVKENSIADPSTVGLASFGIALFCLSFVNAGLVGAGSIGLIIATALICGGLVHIMVALWGFLKMNSIQPLFLVPTGLSGPFSPVPAGRGSEVV